MDCHENDVRLVGTLNSGPFAWHICFGDPKLRRNTYINRSSVLHKCDFRTSGYISTLWLRHLTCQWRSTKALGNPAVQGIEAAVLEISKAESVHPSITAARKCPLACALNWPTWKRADYARDVDIQYTSVYTIHIKTHHASAFVEGTEQEKRNSLQFNEPRNPWCDSHHNSGPNSKQTRIHLVSKN